ncbi:hypothetical protein SARC_13019 [Sphaeroforma arctica JP610]|uniref:Uncharacterized protein n=1 Tax=Sphaeroforma arctica JP610 TaxID=667725 RepID=A0A0L0FCD0_9EUKA|nr:hypothetical protein SARC_13019 [Sphaeroforma arctica JP610]KNC74432.1 hypothetical protein SARC_13019 [Sphaeroforma arctica JP610]|eukprot:XP_014148334.1 hypothetical protein SARC_13019 [Sphaeroforma arctica JP610]
MRNTRSAKRARIATTGTSNAATGTTQSSQSNIHACNDTNDEPEPTQPLEKGADTHKDARVMLLQPIEKDGDTLNSKHSKHTANKVRNALARGTKRGSSTRDGTEKGVHSSKNQAVTRNSDVQNSLTTVQMDVMIPHDILVLIIQHCDEKELLEYVRCV